MSIVDSFTVVSNFEHVHETFFCTPVALEKSEPSILQHFSNILLIISQVNTNHESSCKIYLMPNRALFFALLAKIGDSCFQFYGMSVQFITKGL